MKFGLIVYQMVDLGIAALNEVPLNQLKAIKANASKKPSGMANVSTAKVNVDTIKSLNTNPQALPKWKYQSLQFRQAIRQARMYEAQKAGAGGSNKATHSSSSISIAASNRRNDQISSFDRVSKSDSSGVTSVKRQSSRKQLRSTDISQEYFDPGPTVDPSYIQCPHCKYIFDL